jgi:hypothetical protein
MIVKRGDLQPIKICLDGDEQLICEKCQKPKLLICFTQEGQEPVCECQIEEQGE